jgi:hypothetical protein
MAKVRVVLSWSRPRSREVARILREWLQNVIQGIDPWMSEEDIPKGSQWLLQLQRALADSRFGIVCLTPENVTAEWLHFEAGAIWKALDEGRVCPFLVGIPGGASNINPPLGLFQACDAPAWAADLLWPEPGTGVVDLDLDRSPDSPDVVLGASPLAREVAQVLAQQKARAAALRNRAKKKE